MSRFEYEKPSAVEISEKELDAIAAVLSSGGGSSSEITYEGCIHRAAGFAENSIGNVISQLSDAISARFSSKSAAYRAWLFFRILGGFVYNDDGEGCFDGIKWDSVAGPLSYSSYSEGSTVPTYEETYFVSMLGMSNERYRLLRYYVRLQHEFCGASDPGIDDNLNSYWTRFKTYFPDYSFIYIPDGSNRAVTDKKSFKWFLECNYAAMKGMCDFAHMCIIVSTHLAEAAGFSFGVVHNAISTSYPGLSGRISLSEERKMLAGWLGDLSFPGKTTGKVSMDKDDYFADIDAVRISKFCVGYDYNYKNAVKDHYSTVASETRRSFFLNNCASSEDILTYTRCTSADGSGRSNSQWLSYVSGSKAYQDLYGFYLIMNGTNDEPVL